MITTTTKITFIPEDGSLGIDDKFLLNIDKSYFDWVPKNVHAFHWYGEEYGGQIEFIQETPFSIKPPNERITELGIWENLIQLFYDEEERIEQKRVEEIQSIELTRDYLQEFRNIRNIKLQTCDWTQLPDVRLTESQVIAWKNYRQELRDLPENIIDPKLLVNDLDHELWPNEPQ